MVSQGKLEKPKIEIAEQVITMEGIFIKKNMEIDIEEIIEGFIKTMNQYSIKKL